MRILFVGPNRIGDAVLASGLVDHLVGTYPGARLTVACGAAPAPLFEALPGLEQLIAMHKRPRGGHWRDLWQRVVGRRWSLVVDVRRSIIPWTVLASRRAVAPPSRDHHEHAVVAFARTLGLADDPPAPTVWTREEHGGRGGELIPDGGPVLGIGPAANWAGKIWPAENFVALAERLTDPDGDAFPRARVAVFGAESERAIVQPVLDALDPSRRIDLVGRIDLPVAAACLRRCALYIGNDSGLMHLAAACGTPTLGLFGPSLPERYAPWGPHTDWVRTPESLDELVSRPGYDPRTTGTLMGNLTVDDVAVRADALRRRTGDAPR